MTWSGRRRSLPGPMAAKHRGLFPLVIPGRRREPTTRFGSRARRSGMIVATIYTLALVNVCSPPIKQKPPLRKCARSN